VHSTLFCRLSVSVIPATGGEPPTGGAMNDSVPSSTPSTRSSDPSAGSVTENEEGPRRLPGTLDDTVLEDECSARWILPHDAPTRHGSGAVAPPVDFGGWNDEVFSVLGRILGRAVREMSTGEC